MLRSPPTLSWDQRFCAPSSLSVTITVHRVPRQYLVVLRAREFVLFSEEADASRRPVCVGGGSVIPWGFVERAHARQTASNRHFRNRLFLQ